MEGASTVVGGPPSAGIDQRCHGPVGIPCRTGFERQPWTRPDPEPLDTKTYHDARGYVVGARAYTTAGGRELFEVTVMSPCANEG